MSIRRIAAAVTGMLMALALPAAAQRAAVQQDSAEAQLRGVLRAFYFNLAHHDWEAIAADVLSAKVMASRPAPASIQTATRDRVAPNGHRARPMSRWHVPPAPRLSSTRRPLSLTGIGPECPFRAVALPRLGQMSFG